MPKNDLRARVDGVGDNAPPVRRRRRGSGAITLADVARMAGVSPITASRALNAPETVAAETLARVRDAVARSGYVPNLLAGGLASARSRLVAAVVPTITGPVFLRTIEALTEQLEAAGYQLMVGQSGYTHSREDALLDAIIGRRPDAIVLTGVMHSTVGRNRLIASSIPVVETWDLTPTPIDMLVGFSHEATGEAVARHLAATKRERFAVLTADDARGMRRLRAFSDTIARLRGVNPTDASAVHLVSAPGTLASGRDGLRQLLQTDPRIDAIFCSSDLIALGVLLEAQARGIQVPAQLAVVGFGDLDFAADAHPALTTVRIDGGAIGRQAARFIVSRVNGEEIPARIVDVGFELVVRDSG